jgi:hypothetical protein
MVLILESPQSLPAGERGNGSSCRFESPQERTGDLAKSPATPLQCRPGIFLRSSKRTLLRGGVMGLPTPELQPTPQLCPRKGSAFTHQVLSRPQVYLLHQGAGQVVAQGDDTEGKLGAESKGTAGEWVSDRHPAAKSGAPAAPRPHSQP